MRCARIQVRTWAKLQTSVQCKPAQLAAACSSSIGAGSGSAQAGADTRSIIAGGKNCWRKRSESWPNVKLGEAFTNVNCLATRSHNIGRRCLVLDIADSEASLYALLCVWLCRLCAADRGIFGKCADACYAGGLISRFRSTTWRGYFWPW